MIAITVVSVCYNEEKNIARTIESVLAQTTTDYEYIICDGLSTDATVEIAKSYQDKFAEKGISYRVFSEKDNGIYDAMNKGIEKAQGQYMYFLNAGDWLCDEQSLSHFVQAIRKDDNPAVYYADYYYVDQHRATRVITDDALLPQEMSLGHPSMVARTDLMRRTPFDTRYRIAADYNFVLGLKMQGLSFIRLDVATTYFLSGGLSGQAMQETNEELRNIHMSYGLAHQDIEQAPISLKQKLVRWLIGAAPKGLWRFWTQRIKRDAWVEY